MNNNQVGINNIQVKSVIKKLTVNLEIIEKRFFELSKLFDNIQSFCDTPSGYEFKRKYDTLKQNYEVIHKNFISYIEDFDKLCIKYGEVENVSLNFFDVKQ